MTAIPGTTPTLPAKRTSAIDPLNPDRPPPVKFGKRARLLGSVPAEQVRAPSNPQFQANDARRENRKQARLPGSVPAEQVRAPSNPQFQANNARSENRRTPDASPPITASRTNCPRCGAPVRLFGRSGRPLNASATRASRVPKCKKGIHRSGSRGNGSGRLAPPHREKRKAPLHSCGSRVHGRQTHFQAAEFIRLNLQASLEHFFVCPSKLTRRGE